MTGFRVIVATPHSFDGKFLNDADTIKSAGPGPEHRIGFNRLDLTIYARDGGPDCGGSAPANQPTGKC